MFRVQLRETGYSTWVAEESFHRTKEGAERKAAELRKKEGVSDGYFKVYVDEIVIED